MADKDLAEQLKETQAKLDKANAANEQLNADLEEALGLNEELQRQLDKKEKNPKSKISVVTAQFNGKNYGFKREKFFIPGMGNMTASDASVNNKAMQKLVECESPILYEVNS